MTRGGVGTNVIHQVPHNAVREKAMGNVNRDPTSAELAEMGRLTDKAMADGAWGLSTGLIYNPGIYSKTPEIVALAKVAAKHSGHYASHLRGEGVKYPIDSQGDYDGNLVDLFNPYTIFAGITFVN